MSASESEVAPVAESKPHEGVDVQISEERVHCQWDDCNQPFTELQGLVDHINNGAATPTKLKLKRDTR